MQFSNSSGTIWTSFETQKKELLQRWSENTKRLMEVFVTFSTIKKEAWICLLLTQMENLWRLFRKLQSPKTKTALERLWNKFNKIFLNDQKLGNNLLINFHNHLISGRPRRRFLHRIGLPFVGFCRPSTFNFSLSPYQYTQETLTTSLGYQFYPTTTSTTTTTILITTTSTTTTTLGWAKFSKRFGIWEGEVLSTNQWQVYFVSANLRAVNPI